ncbi:AAA family ATPase [Gemmatimonadota bacterium]
MTECPHLKLLGVPALTDGYGEALKLRTRKQLGLLIYLSFEARLQPVTRDKLADLIWPDSANPLHSLSQALTEIRNKVGSDAFVADRMQLRLQVDIATDLDLYNLESLPSHLPTPLEGLETCGGPHFARWVETKRDCVLSQLEATLKARLVEDRAHGRVQAVRERAEQLYSIDPYNEDAVQALIGDRVDSGNWAGALRLFQKHLDVSKTDLGREPSTETLASLRRIERRVLEHPQDRNSIKGASRPQKSKPQLCIGREAQLAHCESLAKEVFATRELRSCVIRGPDGVGKTTVLRRFVVTTATGGTPAYLVTCQKIGQSIPFAAVSDLLEQMSRDPSLSATDSMWLAEASRVAPGIKAAYPGIPDPPVTPPEFVRVRLGEAIKRMLEAVADSGPVMLAFDDLHYMDPASREVLHMLARKLHGTPAILMAAVRCSESIHGLGSGEGIDGILWQDTIDLRPLDDVQTTELISALSRSDDPVNEAVLQKILELAEGSPLVTEMLVSDWNKSGAESLVMVNVRGEEDNMTWCPPDTMRSAFARQYDGLSKCAQRLAHLLATAGRRVSIEDTRRLLAVPSETLGAAVFTLIERGIVRLEGNALGFKNDLHRAFVYSTLPQETRRYQHAHLAQHLSAAKDQGEFQHALEASHHFLKAGWIDEATNFACLGADRAITCGAPKEAVKSLEAVCGIRSGDPDNEIAILLARAYSAQGSYKQSKSTLQSILSIEATNTQAARAAHLWAEALHRGRLADDDDTLMAAAKHAVAAATNIGDQRLMMKTQQIAAEVAYEAGRWDVLENIETDCANLARETNDTEVGGLADLTLGYCRLVSGDPRIAAGLFSKSAKLFRSLKLDSSLHRALTGLGISESNVGHFDTAHDAFEGAAATAARSGDTVANANALQNLGSLSNELGRFAEAALYFRTAIALDTDISTSRVSTALFCNAANLSLALGNLDEASAFLVTATAAADRSQLWHHFVNVHLTGADLHLAKGENDEAWVLVKDALALTGDRYRLVPDLGQYWRLRRHYYTATGGDSSVDSSSLMKVAHVLELNAFDEWCSQNDQRTEALDELAELGLFGVLARLAAVGVRYGPMKSATAEPSGAGAVKEAFPDQQWEVIPSAVLS